MKDLSVKQKVQHLITPALMVVMGALLLFRPDSASAFVGKLLGWGVIAVGLVWGVYALRLHNYVVIRAIPVLACIAVGVWMLRSPLALAALLGRMAGILIVLQGVQDIIHAVEWKCSMTWAVVATAVGALLIFVPMTASRFVMGLCGVVLMALGGLTAYYRITEGSTPDSQDEVIEL